MVLVSMNLVVFMYWPLRGSLCLNWPGLGERYRVIRDGGGRVRGGGGCRFIRFLIWRRTIGSVGGELCRGWWKQGRGSG